MNGIWRLFILYHFIKPYSDVRNVTKIPRKWDSRPEASTRAKSRGGYLIIVTFGTLMNEAQNVEHRAWVNIKRLLIWKRCQHWLEICINNYWGSPSAIFNIDLDLDLNPMFASMEHMHMNRNIFNIDLHLDPNLMLYRGKHRVRVEIKVDIENSRKTTLLLG